MKLHDGGATIALVVIGVIYFGDWVINKLDPPPKQCTYSTMLDNGTTKHEVKDCDSPD